MSNLHPHFGALVVMLVLATAGCNSDDDGDRAQDTATAADTGDGGDTSRPPDADTHAATDIMADTMADADAHQDIGPDTSPPSTRVIGRLNLTWYGADVFFPYVELHGHAIFEPHLGHTLIESPVAVLATARRWPATFIGGLWELPPVGKTLRSSAPPDLSQLPSAVGDDAGYFVSIGTQIVLNPNEAIREQDGSVIYEGDPAQAWEVGERQSLGKSMDLEIGDEGDLQGVLLPDAVSLPPAVELTNVDPRQPLPLRAGQDVILEWNVPSDPGSPSDSPSDSNDTILITVLSGNEQVVIGTEDDGYAEITEYIAPYIYDAAFLEITIARLRQNVLQLPDGRLEVVTISRQYLYPAAVGSWDMAPSVWPIGETTEVELRLWDLDASDVDLAMGSDNSGVSISDVTVVDAQGHLVRFMVTVDDDAATGPIALDLFDPMAGQSDPALWRYEGEDVWVAAPLPSAGDCESAVDEGFVADGTYLGDDGGLDYDWFDVNTTACAFGNPDGREQVIPLQLAAGERLDVRVWRPGRQAVAYLARDCDDYDLVRACAEAASNDEPANLVYVAEDAEEFLLVIDSDASPGGLPRDYLVDIRRTPSPFLFDKDRLGAGASQKIGIYSLVGDLSADNTTLDFGPDANVTVTFDDPPSPFAELSVTTADYSAATLDLSATVDGVAYHVPKAITMRRYLAPESCAVADEAIPLGPGWWDGAALDYPFESEETGACANAFGIGPEAVYRLDLAAGQTVRIRAWSDGDVQLYLTYGCDVAPVSCVDRFGYNLPDFLQWTAPAAPTSLYLVVDDQSDSFVTPFQLFVEFAQ